MPLGDSITIGYGEITAPEYMSGYRRPLYLTLKENEYEVNFVGSRQDGELAQPAFDYDHEGWGGYRDDHIALYVYGWLQANPADVILLHIGTNGLDPDPSDVRNILNEIDRYERDYNRQITVLLARIINRVPYSATTTQFNDNVEGMALIRIAAGDRIVVVDMEGSFDYSIHMWDDIHPNELGYAKMAEVWFDAIEQILPLCVPDLDISPSSHNFGNVQVNATSTRAFTITNAGTTDLVVGALSVTGANKDKFLLRNDLCSGKTVPYSGTCTFDLVFAPVAEGFINGTLAVPSNDYKEPSLNIALAGTGFLSAGNNFPSRPRLIAPVEGGTVQGTEALLKWRNSTDPDGDRITYHVYCCENENLTGCKSYSAASTSARKPLYAGLGMAGTLFALFGTITAKRRKRLLLFIGILFALCSLLISCGGGGGSGGDGPGESSYTVGGLDSGTKYYWKVVADDGNGASNPSETRSFRTQ